MNIDAVRDSVGYSPRKSLRLRSQEFGIPRESIRRILVKDLHLYPYRIQIKHKLAEGNKEKHVYLCHLFCDRIDDNPDFLDDVWFQMKLIFFSLVM